MLREAKEDLPDGIYIHFRTDGSLFNLRRLLARTKNHRGTHHLSKAISSFGRLSERVWQSLSLRLSTKIQVYRAVVVLTLLYFEET